MLLISLDTYPYTYSQQNNCLHRINLRTAALPGTLASFCPVYTRRYAQFCLKPPLKMALDPCLSEKFIVACEKSHPIDSQ